jgi:MFS family permease
VSGASLQLVVGGYTIAYAMLLITGARLGGRYGRRRTYLAGVLVFTAASRPGPRPAALPPPCSCPGSRPRGR